MASKLPASDKHMTSNMARNDKQLLADGTYMMSQRRANGETVASNGEPAARKRRASGEQPGSLVTRPFKLAGTKLQLNVSATAGRIRVEVLDAQRNPLPGFSGSAAPWQTAVDSLRWQPQWKTNLAPLRGKLVRLRFQLENASLYAFQIK